jgi:hypothetical protein
MSSNGPRLTLPQTAHPGTMRAVSPGQELGAVDLGLVFMSDPDNWELMTIY